MEVFALLGILMLVGLGYQGFSTVRGYYHRNIGRITECPYCKGKGIIPTKIVTNRLWERRITESVKCKACNGEGIIDNPDYVHKSWKTRLTNQGISFAVAVAASVIIILMYYLINGIEFLLVKLGVVNVSLEPFAHVLAVIMIVVAMFVRNLLLK